MGRAQDGTHISDSAGRLRFHCEGCGEPLDEEQWWITSYPQAVHTRCRNWRSVKFPFARHLGVLGRAEHALEDDAAVELVKKALRYLHGLEQQWPIPGAKGVLNASELLRRLRARLCHLDVDPKWVNQI